MTGESTGPTKKATGWVTLFGSLIVAILAATGVAAISFGYTDSSRLKVLGAKLSEIAADVGTSATGYVHALLGGGVGDDGKIEPVEVVKLTGPGKPVLARDLPEAVRAPYQGERKFDAVLADLRRRPAFDLTDRTLSLVAVGAETGSVTLYFSELALNKGSKIAIGDRNVRIIVKELIANGGGVISFEENPAIPPLSSPVNGQPGVSGPSGRSSGSLELVVLGHVRGQLPVVLNGLPGGAGGAGGKGVAGEPGEAGQSGSDSLFSCTRPVGNGGPGGAGMSGALGGRGGDGGGGGNLQLIYLGSNLIPRSAIQFTAAGGEPGVGGPGGPGGDGGPGGSRGWQTFYCRGGVDGAAGAQGPVGPNGAPGSRGPSGMLKQIPLPRDQILGLF
ncbi:hypothetical protein CCP2SC5_540012 [Azospirillaceae bacterium]